jgi:hypothetical protein
MTAGRATPEEVGRVAGLKIRRDLAQRHKGMVATKDTHSSQLHKGRHEAVAAAAQHPGREQSARTAEVSTLKVQSAVHRPKPREVEAEASTEPSPFAETGISTEPSPVAAPSPFGDGNNQDELEPPAEAHPSPRTAIRVRAEAKAGDPENTLADPDPTESDAKILTRRAALRTVSLNTSHFGMPVPLVGSRAILEHQNAMSDAEGLERIEDEDDLADRIAKRLLVPVPTSIALTINGNLPVNHRYCRPWTAQFLSDLARSHAGEFHRPLEVSSAVRTVAYQKRLMEINGNAAAAEGDIVSPHLTGATIDIAKSPLSRQEIAWMRTHLLPLEQAGKIDVEEEFQQACFHITVYKSYAPAHRATRSTTLQAKRAKPDVALQDAGQTEVAQADVAEAQVAQSSAPHAHVKHRRHARAKVVAQVDDPAGAMAARGR